MQKFLNNHKINIDSSEYKIEFIDISDKDNEIKIEKISYNLNDCTDIFIGECEDINDIKYNCLFIYFATTGNVIPESIEKLSYDLEKYNYKLIILNHYSYVHDVYDNDITEDKFDIANNLRINNEFLIFAKYKDTFFFITNDIYSSEPLKHLKYSDKAFGNIININSISLKNYIRKHTNIFIEENI